jgi:hypothetical protein
MSEYIDFIANYCDRWCERCPFTSRCPIQSDWNGSAKVALISLERSEAAWRVIAEVSRDRQAATVFAIASVLRGRVAGEFPDAMAFVRPGFDER